MRELETVSEEALEGVVGGLWENIPPPHSEQDMGGYSIGDDSEPPGGSLDFE